MLVSVIVPVYKVEQYLPKCIESIRSQTYENLEIILVDDGSPDRCPQICDGYAEEDSRIKVVHKTNGGLSDARNVGIANAHGDYLIFLDSDDWWNNPESLQMLVEETQRGTVDLVLFCYQEYYEDTQKTVLHKYRYKPDLQASSDLYAQLEQMVASADWICSACICLIRAEVVRKHRLVFQVGLLSEDIDWTMNLWVHISSFRICNEIFYTYRQRNNSITKSFGLKHALDLLSIIESWSDFAEHNIENRHQKAAYNGYCAYQFSILLGLFYQLSQQERLSFPLSRLKKMDYLLDWANNRKTRLVARLYKMFGLRVTAKILKCYIDRRH